jgi:signal transduction histidine kinase/CheY-like chemotaxis protein/PAS domain-containing protein
MTGILDGLPFGVVLLNDRFLIRGINAEGARLLGRHQSTLFGAAFPDIWSALTESDASAVFSRLHAVAETREPMPQTQTRCRLGTADSIPVEWTCQAIAHEGCLGLIIGLRDRSREEELREERNRLAAIAEETPSPIIELDRHGQVLYANPAMVTWLTTLGYRDDGIPCIVPHNLLRLVAQCLQSGKPVQGLDVCLPEASFSWTFCPVVTHGLVRGYALDITGIHAAQQELRRAADQLQESNRRLDKALADAQESVRAKTAFLATMSHEIRTPMNGVIGMTSLLMETPLSPEQQSYANTIRQCGEALLSLINSVLECSKIEAGKVELEHIDFNLRTAVEDVLAQFAERAETKGLELTGLVHAAVPTALRGDPGRLRQILTNLVGNAVKFTDKGEVTLQAYLERDSPSHALIRFEVADSGIGIPPEVQSKLFSPFVQADSSTTRKYGGTGLGLSISKQLVEMMQGQIGITSAAGHGSTFWCTISFAKQADSPCAILPLGDLDGRRILIVDDNESNRLILHHLVTGWGMLADSAENAADALRQVAEAHVRGISYDLAILDVMMPGKDGLQLAREFHQHPAAAGMRIVVLTSLLQRGHAEQARQAGAMGYLPKPARHDQLRECLRTVLGIARVDAEDARYTDPAPPQLVTRHSLADNMPRQRILVVEDNLINQRLAVRMAEKLGYHPDVVGNGKEALAALANEEYVLVLMDCQMPVMDGFEATRLIRERETAARSEQDTPHPSPRTPHIPIIAVTANAMQGDRELCLAAGMDDYLSKPIQLDTLRAVLHRWAAPPSTADAPPSAAQSNDQGIFDAAQMFHNIGDDHELFAQLVVLFLDRYQAMLAAIKEGLIGADAGAVTHAAHALKGTAGNLCASEVTLAASRLEAVGHLGTLRDAPPIYAHLEMEVLRLVRVLGNYRQGYNTVTKSAA